MQLILYLMFDYLSTLKIKLNCVSKRGPRSSETLLSKKPLAQKHDALLSQHIFLPVVENRFVTFREMVITKFLTKVRNSTNTAICSSLSQYDVPAHHKKETVPNVQVPRTLYTARHFIACRSAHIPRNFLAVAYY